MRWLVFIGIFTVMAGAAFAQTPSYGKANTMGTVTKSSSPVRQAAPTATRGAETDVGIKLYFDKFRVRKTLGGRIYCQMTFYAKNDTDMQLDSLVTQVRWTGMLTKLNFENVAPHSAKTLDYALTGAGCYTMGQKPTLDISACFMRSKGKDNKIVDVAPDVCKSMISYR